MGKGNSYHKPLITDANVLHASYSSSGIQILPAIQPVVSKLFTFIRSPTWVSPLIGLDQHRRYTEEEKTKFVNNPESHINLRKKIEERINGSYEMFFDQSDKQKSIRSVVESKMKQRLNNPQLQEKLIPSFSVGCRRLTPGVNYLETLSADNVQPVFGEIRRVYEDRIVIDDGTVYPVDVLICATGFDTTFKPRFPLQGRSQKLLSDMWKCK
jgi:cyclohexanone monooxygenase